MQLQGPDLGSFRRYGNYLYCDLDYDALQAHKYQVRVKRQKPYKSYNKSREMARRVRQMNG